MSNCKSVLLFGFACCLVGHFANSRLAADEIAASQRQEIDPKTFIELGYTPLFDGKTLDGWTNPYDYGDATVVDGEIHLKANKKFFLVTEKTFGDFRLVADIRLPEGQANSGVMFRCHVEPNRVYGYQAECDGSDRRWSGGFYDEGRRSWIWPSIQGRSQEKFLRYEEESQDYFKQPRIRGALDRDGWNRYEIECRGKHISIHLNGVKITDLQDPVDQEGHIGIQHHGEKGQVYRFRNILIKELPPIPAKGAVSLQEQEPQSVE